MTQSIGFAVQFGLAFLVDNLAIKVRGSDPLVVVPPSPRTPTPPALVPCHPFLPMRLVRSLSPQAVIVLVVLLASFALVVVVHRRVRPLDV